MQKVKIALAGCGRISQRHTEAIAACGGAELALACDIIPERAKKLGDAFSIPYVTAISDIRGVDVITIATPSGMHPDHVIEAAEKCDAPYIVCEKPISLTVRELVDMYKRVKKTGKTILPVYQNRYNPLVEFMKNTVRDNVLGTVYQFSCNIFWHRDAAYFNIDWHGTTDLDGGVLYTQASHYVDLILFLFGPVRDYHGVGSSLRKLEVKDTLSAVFRFENGVVGSLNTTVNSYKNNYLTELTIIGEKGTVRLSGTNLNTIDHWSVEGCEKPDMDFKIDHIYGKGHDTMYEYIVKGAFDKFPAYDEVLQSIAIMEKLSY